MLIRVSGESSATVDLKVTAKRANDLLVEGRMLEVQEGTLHLEVPPVSGTLLALD